MRPQVEAASNEGRLAADLPSNHPATPVADVLGVRVDVVNMERVLARLAQMLRDREKGYLSAITVHGVMVAQRDPEFAAAFADAAIAIPDAHQSHGSDGSRDIARCST